MEFFPDMIRPLIVIILTIRNLLSVTVLQFAIKHSRKSDAVLVLKRFKMGGKPCSRFVKSESWSMFATSKTKCERCRRKRPAPVAGYSGKASHGELGSRFPLHGICFGMEVKYLYGISLSQTPGRTE